jgi:mono/diheme cytochrome c family protein
VSRRLRTLLALASATLLLGACDSLPGKPTPEERYVLPQNVMDFAQLWGTNCSGCHGADGRLGPARPLNDPLYLALASDDVLIGVISNGVVGTTMPAFATSAGGTLTDDQIATLVREMRARWAKPEAVAGAKLPPYAAPTGDAQRGAAAYQAACASCHGPDGRGTDKAKGSIVDASYLALVSDQALRSTVIAGRSDLGMPDYRAVAGGPLDDAQIADLVAWLASHRTEFPGSPYPGSSN